MPHAAPALPACYYCGLIADTVDHVTPRHVLDRREALGRMALPRVLTVPACRECNSAIGARIFPTLADRKRFVKDWLRRRHAALLRVPDWTEAELADLGPQMERYVRTGVRHRDIVRSRLAW